VQNAELDLVWHDFIDANPGNDNTTKDTLEKAFGLYDKSGYVSWKIEIPWQYNDP
jgi:hypothetical protein